MLKIHKNQIYSCLKKNGFEPADFKVLQNTEKKDEELIVPAFALQYKDTPFKFIISHSTGSYSDFKFKATRLAPGYPLTNNYPGVNRRYEFIGIERLTEYLEEWLSGQLGLYLKETEVPDLWENIQNQIPLISEDNTSSEDDLKQFSNTEKEQIRLLIKEFKVTLIKRYEPDPLQYETINYRLEYLSSALDRLNKFDWRSLIINTIIAISITLTLDSEQGKQLFELARAIFSNLTRISGN